MSTELEALIARVEDPALRSELARQFTRLQQKRTFGLVFEEHLPEIVTLPGHPIRAGVKVRRRNETAIPFGLMQVLGVTSGIATVRIGEEIEDLSIDDLVVVAEFGDPIYPGLRSTGRIENGGDKPFNSVINGENHHVLEALQFTWDEPLVVVQQLCGLNVSVIVAGAGKDHRCLDDGTRPSRSSASSPKATSCWPGAWTSRRCAASSASPNRPGRGGCLSTAA